MIRIRDNLYVYEDTCNVYVVKSAEEAVLIDFGSGDVLHHLGGIGIKKVTDVCMTHHHRDQGQGLARAAEAGIRIWAPHMEQDLFSRVDWHWQAREIRNNYNVRQDRFSLLRPVPIFDTLRDYETYRFGEYSFTVVPTPGHTIGSVSLLAHFGRERVAFTGDLIAAPGKVWSMAATQWSYNGAEGVAAGMASLLDLQEREPDLLLPSHGQPMERPRGAMGLLVERFAELLRYRQERGNFAQLREQPYTPITEHLLQNRTCFANSFVLLSESGKALVFDFGYDFFTGFVGGADRASRRPWLYTNQALKRDYGVSHIDVAVPTHYHDDHVAGLNLLRSVEGTQVWAAANFADILQHPEAYDLPCLWYDAIPVDRVLPLGQPIRWEEYELTLFPLAGHTLYAVAIFLEVDGKRVLVQGDQYVGSEGLLWNYVYQNRFRMTDYRESAELFAKLRPELLLSGHVQPLWTNEAYFAELGRRGEALERLHRQLLPLADVDLGAEGFAARFKPYETHAEAGKTIALQVEIFNPLSCSADVEARIVMPTGWTCAEDRVTVNLPAHAAHEVSFRLDCPEGIRIRRERVAIDFTVNGRRFGEQAEALVTIE